MPDLFGLRPGGRDLLTSREREQIRWLRTENEELRRANEILMSVSLFFARELDPDRSEPRAVDDERCFTASASCTPRTAMPSDPDASLPPVAAGSLT